MAFPDFTKLILRRDRDVLTVTISSPPMNFVDAPLLRELIVLFEALEDSDVRVAVFESESKIFFLPRADASDIPAYTAAASSAGTPDDQWLGTFLRRVAESKVVTIAKIRGRIGGAGSEFSLSCDMRFASIEHAIFNQPEVGIGLTPGSGAMQHLPRLMGRGRALEVLLGSEDFDAVLAERYGWINRALPDAELDEFVDRLANRIAEFPAKTVRVAKERVNQVTLPPIEQVHRDAQWFQKFARSAPFQARMAEIISLGANTDPAVEADFANVLGTLSSR